MNDTTSTGDIIVPRTRLVGALAGFAIVCLWAMIGVLFFFAAGYSRAPHPDDYRLYLCVFSSIGACTGALGWYLARLVARKRIRFEHVVGVVAIPYGFITFVALSNNPVIALVATVVFGFAILYAYIVRPNADSEHNATSPRA